MNARTENQNEKNISETTLFYKTSITNDMTDEIMPQTQQNLAKKDEKKPGAGGRGAKRNTPGTRTASGVQSGPRPSSRTSNKKSSNPPPSTAESGSDTTSRKGSEAKKPEQRNKSQGGVGRSGFTQRKPSGPQGGRQGSNGPKEQAPNSQPSSSPIPVASAEASAALSSLQRVIADLKTTSPVQPSNTNSFPTSISAPQGLTSHLPPNAPIFQPGASAYPGSNHADPKHRKSASLGASALSGNFNSFAPHLGAMMEDAEDGPGNVSVEDGEIQEGYYHQPSHQPRSQSQSFMAPRFAALAAQQDPVDAVGPSGRPQLAPGFSFGARRRGNSNIPMGPPINEEDVGFQFPQQQQLQNFQQGETVAHEQTHRKTDSGEITGIMAEQVHSIDLAQENN
jgi:protein SSD1